MRLARRLLVIGICSVLASAAPQGQSAAGQSSSSSPQLPTFRAEGRAIEVDVYVTDPQGRFVRGLTSNDFELLEDGQPQEISAFTMVDVPVDRPPAKGKSKKDAPPSRKDSTPAASSDVMTNAVDGRIYVMLLDSPGLRPPQFAHVNLEQMVRLTQRVATQFVDEAMGPRDQMAVIHVQGNLSDAQAFTSDKGLLRAAIARMKPDLDLFGTQQGDPAFPEKYCDVEKIRNSYEALETVADRLGATTGRRKAILWVNGAVPLDADDPAECGFAGAQASSLQFIQRDAIRTATRNNVAIYPIDAVGLTADPRYFQVEPPVRQQAATDPQERSPTPGNPIPDNEPQARKMKRLAALRGIAGETGGEAIVNTNNFSGGFERVVQLHSTYYLLGYRPRDHRDGQFHSIAVRVRRDNLTLRSRKGYRAPDSDAPTEERLMPGVSPAAVAALTNPFPSNGLKLQAVLTPFSGTGNDALVLLGAEVSGLARVGAAEARLEFAYMALDTQGGTFVAPSKTLPLSLPEGTGTASVRYVDRLVLPPGRHEVRLAVYQAGGETGSIVTHVEVPDFAHAPLAMSGIVLVEPEVATPPLLVGDEGLEGTPAATATTRRRFARGETITALAEVYSDNRTKVDNFGVTATIHTAQGAKVKTETPERPGAQPGRSGYTVRLPLAALTPGDYVLTMEAKAGRRSVTRQVPFSVTE
ncbi:MAG TPA: VWA domain-containing protein [Vicinamibacterales bacterium]|nr:VWA domain-containing protein [Vicinamibacterales bacterium]